MIVEKVNRSFSKLSVLYEAGPLVDIPDKMAKHYASKKVSPKSRDDKPKMFYVTIGDVEANQEAYDVREESKEKEVVETAEVVETIEDVERKMKSKISELEELEKKFKKLKAKFKKKEKKTVKSEKKAENKMILPGDGENKKREKPEEEKVD